MWYPATAERPAGLLANRSATLVAPMVDPCFYWGTIRGLHWCIWRTAAPTAGCVARGWMNISGACRGGYSL